MSTVLALDPATASTIAIIAIWIIGFPALVTGLIAYALVQVHGEARENEAERQRRGNSA
jgi:hypothetical protein